MLSNSSSQNFGCEVKSSGKTLNKNISPQVTLMFGFDLAKIYIKKKMGVKRAIINSLSSRPNFNDFNSFPNDKFWTLQP